MVAFSGPSARRRCACNRGSSGEVAAAASMFHVKLRCAAERDCSPPPCVTPGQRGRFPSSNGSQLREEAGRGQSTQGQKHFRAAPRLSFHRCKRPFGLDHTRYAGDLQTSADPAPWHLFVTGNSFKRGPVPPFGPLPAHEQSPQSAGSAVDGCAPQTAGKKAVAPSMRGSHRWGGRRRGRPEDVLPVRTGRPQIPFRRTASAWRQLRFPSLPHRGTGKRRGWR